MVLDFLTQYKYIILFYLAVIIFLVIKRKKLDIQGKIIVLYRMKWGLKWMDKYAKKHRQWVILLGYTGVGVGFVGLVFISYLLIKNLIDYFTAETITAGASIVYPGMKVPGLGVLPFWDWIIAIFIIAERKLQNKSDIAQYSVLAAGSFSNIALALIALLLLNAAFIPLQASMEEPVGFTFDTYVSEDLPFAKAGIEPGTVITGINNQETKTFQEFSEELRYSRPGEEITINTASQDYQIILAENPDNAKRAFLGIQEIKNEAQLKAQYQTPTFNVLNSVIDRLAIFFRWLFLLSFGIGIFNLLPLPFVDGGRMAQVFLQKLKGVAKGNHYYAKVSMFFLLLLLLNLFYPMIANLF